MMLSKFPVGGGTSEAPYCWVKYTKATTEPALNLTGVTLTPNGDAYDIVTTGGDAWGNHYIASPTFPSSANITIEIVPATISVTYFVGVAATAAPQYANLTTSLMIEGGYLRRYTGATNNGQVGTFAVGDRLTVKIKDGVFLAYKNGALLFNASFNLPEYVVTIPMYYGNKNHGTLTFTETTATEQGFVLSENPNKYPDGGYASDGFYYEKAASSVVDMKFATGTGSGTINVTGLAFKPQSIYMYGYFYSMQGYYAWVSLMFNGDEILAQVSGSSAGGFAVSGVSVTDDGFTVTVGDARYGMTWYALGY